MYFVLNHDHLNDEKRERGDGRDLFMLRVLVLKQRKPEEEEGRKYVVNPSAIPKYKVFNNRDANPSVLLFIFSFSFAVDHISFLWWKTVMKTKRLQNCLQKR